MKVCKSIKEVYLFERYTSFMVILQSRDYLSDDCDDMMLICHIK
ncbi:hypothetical protein HMPREF9148_01407 [Prevotella sp. F0091]|nr:hypothetical protein HMPREF9148_01407 [Prevotella sp. F0091]